MIRPLLLLLGLLSVAHAEDLTTTDGKTYTGVTITKVEQDGLRILHASGTAMVPFAKLSADLQKKYNYDPAKAEALAKEEAAKLAEAKRTAKEKQAANEWDGRFQIDPETQDDLTIHYSSYDEHVRYAREEIAREGLTKQYAENRLALVPKGGRLSGSFRKRSSDEAAQHRFTILLFDRDGNEIATAPGQMNHEIIKGPDGLWQRTVTGTLHSPLQEGDRIRIVDQLDNRQRVFTVKAKTAAPSEPATPQAAPTAPTENDAEPSKPPGESYKQSMALAKAAGRMSQLSRHDESTRVADGSAHVGTTSPHNARTTGTIASIAQGTIQTVPVMKGKTKVGEKQDWVFSKTKTLGYIEGVGITVSKKNDSDKLHKVTGEMILYPIGQARYIALDGTKKTVPRFTTVQDDAAFFYLKHGPAPSCENVITDLSEKDPTKP